MSEVQLQRELPDARIARTHDGPKAPGADTVHGVVKIRAVEEVEELRPEIQGYTLANGERLRDAEVDVEQPRPAQQTLGDIPICAERWHRKCVRVELVN